jgi:hypothetical protein
MHITSQARRALIGAVAVVGLAITGVGAADAAGSPPATPSPHSSTASGQQAVRVAAKSAIHTNSVTSTFKTCWQFHGTLRLPVQLGLAPGQPVAVTATEANNGFGDGEFAGDAVIRVDNVSTLTDGSVVARVEVDWPNDLFVCTHYLW